jgi:hypothetical protein
MMSRETEQKSVSGDGRRGREECEVMTARDLVMEGAWDGETDKRKGEGKREEGREEEGAGRVKATGSRRKKGGNAPMSTTEARASSSSSLSTRTWAHSEKRRTIRFSHLEWKPGTMARRRLFQVIWSAGMRPGGGKEGGREGGREGGGRGKAMSGAVGKEISQQQH